MNINGLIKQFVIENNFEKVASRFVIIRNDGVSVYSNIENSLETASVCALVGGVWQAADSLNQLVNTSNEAYDYRMTFDTSSSGLYILPIKIKQDEYYVCTIYKDVNNPAKLKRNIRVFRDKLDGFLQGAKIDLQVDRSDYLFKNISDEEIDKMFDWNGI